MIQRRTVATLGVAVACLASTGCIAKAQDGDITVYYFEWWSWGICLLAGVFLVWLGWKLRVGSFWRGWMIILVGCLIGLGVAPSFAADTLTVDSEHFEVRRAFWFDSFNLRFDDIAAIDLTSKERQTRRGKRTDYNLECTLRTGEIVTVPIGDLMKEGLGQVLDYAADKDIVVTDRTGR